MHVRIDTPLRLETESRVVVVDVGECSSLDEVARCADSVLDAEGLGHVVAFGQSIAGILARAYAMRSASRPDGMALAQTVP
jgi:pimeloyl-ACP methyl ester carboxylesterase